MRGPIPGSRWVEPKRLLAGPHPLDDVGRLADAGIDVIVDLTQDGELPAYAVPAGIRRLSRPITDFGCPTSAEMRETLDLLDGELARGSRVYVHCRGGIGRTGTVLGCYFIRRGATADEALDRLRELRKEPEADEQLRLVEGWRG